MYMTESEILAEWKGAKDRKKQISILADENCCTPGEIVATLKAAGVDGRAIRAPGDGMKKKKEGGGGPSTAPTETPSAAPPEAPDAAILLSMIASLKRENEKLWALVMTMASKN